MSAVISVENIGKKYLLSHQREQQPYVALRDVLSDGVKNLGLKLLGRGKPVEHGAAHEEFWALRDVSFKVKQGERIGIIGRNGAGKSTLLKILSRITEPTTGSIRIKGRVASLLEVGTGFHPELTGRENIYLNGAILGMSRTEIKKKFAEIVDFAEIERFLDTPVKRYSSGMYVRLAFAVAAHLEPEILVVDEVLAVGDAQFQAKCMGKMEQVSTREGRTVLFVSHNLQAISELCTRVILLEGGSVAAEGTNHEIINRYLMLGYNLHDARKDLTAKLLRVKDLSKGESLFKWKSIHILNSMNMKVSEVLFYEPFEIVFSGYAEEDCEKVTIGLALSSRRTGSIFSTHQIYNGIPDRFSRGNVEFRVRLDPNILAPGHYEVEIGAIGNSRVADYIKEAIVFSVSEAPFDADKQWRFAIQAGFIYYPCSWRWSEGGENG